MTPNNSRPFRPIVTGDERILGGPLIPTETIVEQGLYSRADLDLDIDDIEARLEAQNPMTTLEDYQYWAERHWKTVHGTYDSTERFSRKLVEERLEVVEAFDNYQLAGEEDDNARSSLMSELGDVLWCLSALGSNGGASMDTGMRTWLYKYVLGTQHVHGLTTSPPPWREAAAVLATKWDEITVHEIDSLISNGFEPAISPVMNIYEDSGPDCPETSVENHLKLALGATLLAAVRIQTDMQYGRRNPQGDQVDTYVTQPLFESYAIQLSETIAAAVLEIAYIAHRGAHASLAGLMSQNVAKLTYRVEHGRVDKTDGLRESTTDK